jgi:hypothetical protein
MKTKKISLIMLGLAAVGSVTCLLEPRSSPALVTSDPPQSIEQSPPSRSPERTRIQRPTPAIRPSTKVYEPATTVQARPALTPQQLLAAQTQLLEEHIRADMRDEVATDRLYASLEEHPLPGAADTTVTCGRELCRLNAAFESASAREQALSALTRAIPWDFDAYYRAGDDPERHMVVYLTREEVSLPVVEDTPQDRAL